MVENGYSDRSGYCFFFYVKCILFFICKMELLPEVNIGNDAEKCQQDCLCEDLGC